MTSVNYKIIGRKEKVIRTDDGEACYSKVFRKVYKDHKSMICYEPRIYTKNKERDIIPWIKAMNAMGFPCKYLGTAEPDNIYNIPVGNYMFRIDFVNYKYKNHLASTLTLMRYLYERGLENIVDHFFVAKNARLSNFDALKYGVFKGCSGNGHTHYRSNTNILYRKADVMEELKSNPTINDNYESTRLHYIWNSNKKIPFYGDSQNVSISKFKSLMKNEKFVYVVGGDTEYVNWFDGYKVTKDLEKASVVVFTGGEDVDPSLYGENKNPRTWSNLTRDLYEKEIFEKARALKLPMIGICRGSQFLCVMSGGKLVQHQQNPEYIHEIETNNYGKLMITSTHHQAAYPFNLNDWYYKVIGWTRDISVMHEDGNGDELHPYKECEIVYYNNTKCLGIQGHPEFTDYQEKHPKSLATLKKIVNDFLNDNL
jgi:gamma-glutamyl-gamma-aminobutyrate hydrolase PuuD